MDEKRPTAPATQHEDGQGTRSAESLLLRIPDAASVLGIGRTTLYKLIDDGDIRVVHIGRAVRVSRAELHAFVDRRNSDVVR